MSLLDQLRYEPVTRRVRASLRRSTGARHDRRRRRLGAGPDRADVCRAARGPRRHPRAPAQRRGARGAPAGARPRLTSSGTTVPGSPTTWSSETDSVAAAGFAPDDPDLGGRVVVEWAPFDWMEEALPVVGHPHDPFKRIDLLPSERHVVVRLGGVVLADTHRAVALCETFLPTRWYVPHDDVVTDLFVGSTTTSTCAYKGHAAYVSLASGRRGRCRRRGPRHRLDLPAPARTRWMPSRACSASGPSAPTSSSTARPCPGRSPRGRRAPSWPERVGARRGGEVEHARRPRHPGRRGGAGAGRRRAPSWASRAAARGRSRRRRCSPGRGRPAGGPASPRGRRAGSGSRPAASAARRHGCRPAPPGRARRSRCRRRPTSGSTAAAARRRRRARRGGRAAPPGPAWRRRAPAAAPRRRRRRARLPRPATAYRPALLCATHQVGTLRWSRRPGRPRATGSGPSGASRHGSDDDAPPAAPEGVDERGVGASRQQRAREDDGAVHRPIMLRGCRGGPARARWTRRAP